jgi:hypothetical protein
MNRQDDDRNAYTVNYNPELLHVPVTESNARVEAVMAAHRVSFVRRLFPNEEDRVVRAHELDQINSGFEFRRRALQMAVETKLQAMEEMCNHVLVTGKSEIRRQRQEFFADQRLRLQVAMNDCADRFNQDLERRLGELERYKNPYLRKREEQRLLAVVDQFHAMLAQLAEDFLSIIQEGVHR